MSGNVMLRRDPSCSGAIRRLPAAAPFCILFIYCSYSGCQGPSVRRHPAGSFVDGGGSTLRVVSSIANPTLPAICIMYPSDHILTGPRISSNM